MIKIENIKTMNFDGAFRGMRNPLESWDRSDSIFGLEDMEWCESDRDVVDTWMDSKYPDLADATTEYMNQKDDYSEWVWRNAVLSSDHGLIDTAFIGPEDLKLAQKLVLSGSDHSKFMRQIFISMDITAPLYW